MEKIFENNDFIIWKDNKGVDFAYIENKTKKKIIIEYGEENKTIEIIDWIALFDHEKDIINCLLNNIYKIIKVE